MKNLTKQYKLIRILVDRYQYDNLKWSPPLIYDVETNKVVIGDATHLWWIPLQDVICSQTEPYCRSGRWPENYREEPVEITSEEFEEIKKHTVDFVE